MSASGWFLIDGCARAKASGVHGMGAGGSPGLLPGQIDIAGRIIELLEAIGLVRNVVRVPAEQRDAHGMEARAGH